MSRTGDSVERFRTILQRTIHAQTCRERRHRAKTMPQCRVPTAEALRILDEARKAEAGRG